MTFQQELASWNPFIESHSVQAVPVVGETAPSISQLAFPRADNKPTIVAFLRHCGCPFTEKLIRILRSAAEKHPEVAFTAISHSNQQATSRWLEAVGGAGSVQVIVDEQKEMYGAYGLGLSSYGHNWNPWSMTGAIRLALSEQIWMRPTESGSRWQTAGLFAVDAHGVVQYAHVAQTSNDIGDVDNALSTVSR